MTNTKLLLAANDLILGLGCSIITKLVILVNINYLQLQVVLSWLYCIGRGPFVLCHEVVEKEITTCSIAGR